MWQRARELGALPDRLVRPGDVFDWPTLEPWADKISVREAEAEVNEALAKVQEAEKASESGGAKVKPGASREVDPKSDTETRRKRTSQRSAETP